MKPKIPRPLSRGEECFAQHCKAYNLSPEREYAFTSGRMWRFDFAWPRDMVAVEVEGGTKFGMSRHSRGDGFIGDCRKYNRAAMLGWRVFRFTTVMVESGEAIDIIKGIVGI